MTFQFVSKDRIDRLPCSGIDPLNHRCGANCLPTVARGLPKVDGYVWKYGSTAGGWSLWLENRDGSRGRWFVLDQPSAHTARELVAVIHAFAVGAKGLDFAPKQVFAEETK